MKDRRELHRIRAQELIRKGYVLVCNCPSQETFSNMTKQRKLPVGSKYLWAIDEIYAPKDAPFPATGAAVNTVKEARQAA